MRVFSFRAATDPRLKTQLAQAGMIVRTPAERPMVFALGGGDRHVIDAGVTPAHEAALVEFPVLVTVGPEPGPAVVVPFVRESHRDAIAGKGPDLLDQPIVELPCPLALEEGDDLGTPVDEFRAVSPAAVLGVGESDALRLTGIPSVLRCAHLLRSSLGGEGR